MGGIWKDLRYAVRTLIKSPAFSLAAVITLALGIGANTAIFTVVNAVLLRPLPYPQSEKVVQVGRVFDDAGVVSDLSEPKFVYLRDHVQSFEAIAATQKLGSNAYLSDRNQTDFIRGVIVSADFFRVLGVQPRTGRMFTTEEDLPGADPVAILGDELWRQRFGADQAILGDSITLNGVDHTVVGIMPPGFEYSGPQDLFVPMKGDAGSQNQGHNWTVIGRLRPGVTVEQAGLELRGLFDRFREAHPPQVKENESFAAMNWRSSITGGIRQLLWILFGAVGFVLLIACANVANLQLTRASSRLKEFAIRTALGAGGPRLTRQLVTEGLVLAVIGGSIGLMFAMWLVGTMLAIVPEGLIPRAAEVALDSRVLLFTLLTSLLTGVLFGLAPVLQMRRADMSRLLKEDARKSGFGSSSGRLRGALVVIEVALALALTIGATLLLRTFANLRGVEPGFEARNVLTLELSPRGDRYDTVAKINELYDGALSRFRSLPGVQSVALTNKLPFDAQFNLPYALESPRKFAGAAQYRLISPDYFDVLKMNIRRGRAFNEADRKGSEPVVIINEAFARATFPDVEPLDRHFFVCCDNGELVTHRVVGVVNETRQRSLIEPAPGALFVPLSQADEEVRNIVQQSSVVLRATEDPALLGPVIRREMSELDPAVPVRNVRTMEQLISRSIAPQRFNLFLLALFATLGLSLAAVGVYGVMSYSVSGRTQEIGLRMALGAGRRDVLGLIVRQGMLLALAGLLLGLAGSLLLTRLLEGMLFGVSPTDPLTFVLVSLMLGAISLLALWIPARRATRVDPMVALRYE